MEARFAWPVSIRILLTELCLLLVSAPAFAAGYKTTNFTVAAPTPQLAKEIGDQAEVYRRDLAMEWLGKELPPWSKSCPIFAGVAQKKGAGGATRFVFDPGEGVYWDMKIQSSRERILDSVLPHEVTHTIFASYFRQPLPRWADEGACTTVEHQSEVDKQERNLIQFLRSGRGIPFSQMFAMKEYPSDVMPLYAQGHSLAEWLIENRGRKEFLEFVGDGMQDENWGRAVRDHYGFNNLLQLQNAWNDWVKQGRPRITPESSSLNHIAANSANGRRTPASQVIYRGQSPDNTTPIGSIGADRSSAGTAVAVASASQSVYAVAAKQSDGQQGREPEAPRPAASMASASIYDASRGGAVLRR